MDIVEREKNYPYSKIGALLAGLLLILIPLVPSIRPGQMFAGLDQVFFVFFYTSLLYILGLALYCLLSDRKKKVSISVIDITITAYLIYGLINVLIVRKWQVDMLWVYKWITMLLGYVIFRTNPHKPIVINSLIISGCAQSLIVVLQYAGLMTSRHTMFHVTGTFDNPGPLGGYLAVGIVLSLYMLLYTIRESKYKTILYSAATLLIGIALVFADSRAAFLGVFVSAIYVFLRKSANGNTWVTAAKIASVTGIVLLITTLFLHRPESARGRLLVWRVAAEMVKDKPTTGHGIYSFSDSYMSYQGEYFMSHPYSEFTSVADDVCYAYNELVHIAVEQGFVGIILFVMILLAILMTKTNRACYSSMTFSAAIICLLVFSLFSYPADVFPLFFLFPVLGGSMEGKKVASFDIRRKAIIIALPLVSAVIFLGYSIYNKYMTISDILIKEAYTKDYNERMVITEDIYNLFEDNKNFRDVYLKILSIDNSISTSELKCIGELVNSYDSYITAGKIYKTLNDLDMAERYLSCASYMIPSRIIPNYLLWEIAIDRNDMNTAMYYAQRIIDQKLKVVNTRTIQIKAEMMLFLDSGKN